MRSVSDETVFVRTPGMPTRRCREDRDVSRRRERASALSRGVNKRRLIASTTKIMTALVAISRTTPNEMLTATNYRAGAGESMLGLKPGEKMSSRRICSARFADESGNDAADTFRPPARHFTRRVRRAMNRQARRSGSRHAFRQPRRARLPRTYSTASDSQNSTGMAAMTVPRFPTVGTNRTDAPHRLDHSSASAIAIRSIGEYPWAVGVKTGHTSAAGYLLVGAAAKLDARVISVVTGEPSIRRAQERHGQAAALRPRLLQRRSSR